MLVKLSAVLQRVQYSIALIMFYSAFELAFDTPNFSMYKYGLQVWLLPNLKERLFKNGGSEFDLFKMKFKSK